MFASDLQGTRKIVRNFINHCRSDVVRKIKILTLQPRFPLSWGPTSSLDTDCTILTVNIPVLH